MLDTLRSRILVAALLALAACNKEAPVSVNIVDVANSALTDVTHLRLRVLDSDGNVFSEQVAPVGGGSATIAAIPSGKPMRIQATGFNAAPPAGTAVSNGMSAPFTVPASLDSNPIPIPVVIFLRPVEQFSPVVSAEDPGTPVKLSTPRAGHTATQLADGRVLITGGFEGTSTDQTKWTYKDSVEFFDPGAGTVTAADSLAMVKSGLKTPRAFHTANFLPATGQVFVSGGEYVSKPATGSPMLKVQTGGLLFDPENGGSWITAPVDKARSRHSATVDRNGIVLSLGGISFDTNTGAPSWVNTLEWWNNDRFESKPVMTTNGSGMLYMARFGQGGVSANNGQFVTSVGGAMQGYASSGDASGSPKLADGEAVRFFQWDANDTDPSLSKMELVGSPLRLATPRTYPATAEVGSLKIVVAGGFADTDTATNPFKLLPTTPTDVVEVIHLSPPSVSFAPSLATPRGQSCAVTLQDGRVLVVGGRGKPAGAVVAVSDATVIQESGDTVALGSGGKMSDARYFHTCTLLSDGSVLVTGGVNDTSGFNTLDSMEIYMPMPPD